MSERPPWKFSVGIGIRDSSGSLRALRLAHDFARPGDIVKAVYVPWSCEKQLNELRRTECITASEVFQNVSSRWVEYIMQKDPDKAPVSFGIDFEENEKLSFEEVIRDGIGCFSFPDASCTDHVCA
jgi:hypothetical protein